MDNELTELKLGDKGALESRNLEACPCHLPQPCLSSFCCLRLLVFCCLQFLFFFDSFLLSLLFELLFFFLLQFAFQLLGLQQNEVSWQQAAGYDYDYDDGWKFKQKERCNSLASYVEIDHCVQ